VTALHHHLGQGEDLPPVTGGRENLLTIMGPSDMVSASCRSSTRAPDVRGHPITEVRAVSMDRDALQGVLSGTARIAEQLLPRAGPPAGVAPTTPSRPNLSRRALSRLQAAAAAGARLAPRRVAHCG